MELYIGIDPGISGAIGVVDERGNVLLSEDLTQIKSARSKRHLDLNQIRRTLRSVANGHDSFAAIEKVSARPGQGVVSMFRFGLAVGSMLGLLTGLEIGLIQVAPRQWMKEFLQYTEGKDSKTKSRLAASYRWPNEDFSLVKSHNRADALFLAEFARKHKQNGST